MKDTSDVCVTTKKSLDDNFVGVVNVEYDELENCLVIESVYREGRKVKNRVMGKKVTLNFRQAHIKTYNAIAKSIDRNVNTVDM